MLPFFRLGDRRRAEGEWAAAIEAQAREGASSDRAGAYKKRS